MCGRYTLVVSYLTDNMKKLIDLCNKNSPVDEQISAGEINPADFAPALIAAEGSIRAVTMQWGFVRRNQPGLLINVRSEDVRSRAMFSRLLDYQRCVLPASGYYEWRSTDHQKHLIVPTDAEAIYLAGLYRVDESGRRQFVVLTRDAMNRHARIHNRMPVVLYTREDARKWLRGLISPENLAATMADQLSIQPVGPEQMSLTDLWDQFEN